jgi:hypothetical protein
LTSGTYSSTGSDENAIKVSKGTLTLSSFSVTKSGDCSDSDGSSFYGTNTAVLATGSSSKITLSNGTITTSGKGANAIVAYNSGTVIASDLTINCSANLSRGIHATGGGVINATNLTITTAGNNSSVIATDRGGGTVTVDKGTYKTTGGDCAVIYSTGTISVTDITGSSSQGEISVIEGSNSITMNNSEISSSSSSRANLILQSGSGDATGYDAKVTVNGGTLTSTSTSAPFLEVTTNTTGTFTCNSATITVGSGILMAVDYNTRWSTKGATGNLVLNGSGYTYTGNVTCDSYSTATVTIGSGATWKGAMDNANTGKSTSVTVNGTWTLSANSYVDKLVVASGATVNKAGFTLTASSTSNSGTIND